MHTTQQLPLHHACWVHRNLRGTRSPRCRATAESTRMTSGSRRSPHPHPLRHLLASCPSFSAPFHRNQGKRHHRRNRSTLPPPPLLAGSQRPPGAPVEVVKHSYHTLSHIVTRCHTMSHIATQNHTYHTISQRSICSTSSTPPRPGPSGPGRGGARRALSPLRIMGGGSSKATLLASRSHRSQPTPIHKQHARLTRAQRRPGLGSGQTRNTWSPPAATFGCASGAGRSVQGIATGAPPTLRG